MYTEPSAKSLIFLHFFSLFFHLFDFTRSDDFAVAHSYINAHNRRREIESRDLVRSSRKVVDREARDKKKAKKTILSRSSVERTTTRRYFWHSIPRSR
uniref:Secreted protein n=1 Tax=Trichogramma kaykai TaxID=54128 RepID=A0ABD2VW48_9HYME